MRQPGQMTRRDRLSSPRRMQRRARLSLAALLLFVTSAATAQTVADHLAACKNEAGDPKARIEACTRAVEGARDNEELRVEALLQRGVLQELWGDQDAAIADYSEIIKLDTTSAIAHFNRRKVRDRLGQQDLAIQDRKSTRLNSSHLGISYAVFCLKKK